MSDNVNHPSHYTSHPSGVECIQITEHMNFNIGNAMKYLWRAGLKSDDAREDLMKARWYADRELERLAGMPVAAPVEAPVARVFNVGDPEPADKETITLSGTGPDGVVKLKYGNFGGYDGLPKVRWWDVGARYSQPTWDEWDVWLDTFGPLTEVVDPASLRPRVFETIGDIPADVHLVSDNEGDTWSRNGSGIKADFVGPDAGVDDGYAPFTEVL